jgi:hypothetical protein
MVTGACISKGHGGIFRYIKRWKGSIEKGGNMNRRYKQGYECYALLRVLLDETVQKPV